MKNKFLISMVFCIILTACSGQGDIPNAIPSGTLEPSFTATSGTTSTPTKNRPTLLPPTSTITSLPPYPNKEVVFDYYVIGDHSVYDIFFDPNSFHASSRLVLYSDGQMIVPSEGESGGAYSQKILSPDEVKRFLSMLESMDFYSLESNQKHDPTDKLYDYGNNYQESFDGRKYCVSVNADQAKTLCVYEPDLQFVIPKMKNILQYLGEYEPEGMTPYHPDRILLWVQSGREPDNDNLPKTAIIWGVHFPHLENSIIYVHGDMAKEIHMLYNNTNQAQVFIQDGIEYTVYIKIVLPHEQLTNAYQ